MCFLGELSEYTIVSSLFIVNLPDQAEGRYLQSRLIYARETFWTAETREVIWHSVYTIYKENCKAVGREGSRMYLKKAKNC